jgi:glucose-like phosphotransferase system IIB component
MELYVDLGAHSYSIYIENNILKDTGSYIEKVYSGKKIMIISDDNVFPLYGDTIVKTLEDEYEVHSLILPHGEPTKSFQSLPKIYSALLEARFSRSDLIIALGGGVIGDLAGFAAASFLRGIKFIQIPTSLLAQVDSSVGGKVAVDLPEGKNLVGAFYQPALVLIDPLVLNTLPERYINDGMGEVIKYGCIWDADLFKNLEAHTSFEDLKKDLTEVIYRCVDIKRIVVEHDQFDTGERMLLPFGLHHFVYLPFFFTSLGGVETIDGQTVQGAINIYNAILGSPSTPFNIEVSRFVMNGKVIFAMFGLPGAALAFYKTALPKNKKKTAALMIAIVVPCILSGITEPLEYSFLFIAPILYVFHALMAGLAYALTYALQFNVAGSASFGGPLLSLIFNGIMGAAKGSNWQVILFLGPIYFVVYYFVFKFIILKKDLKTPGREEESDDEAEKAPKTVISDLIPAIVEAVGGDNNIKSVEACFTRLRIQLNDCDKVVDDAEFTEKLEARGIVHVNGGVQIVYGNMASNYATQMRELLGME